MITGAVPRSTVMVCEQELVFPQASAAPQVRVTVMLVAPLRFVTVLMICTVTELQVSVATG